MSKTGMTILGFVLLIVGVTAFVLHLVNVRFVFLRYLDSFGGGFSLLWRLLFIIAGFVLIYVSKSTPQRYQD